MSGRRHVCAVLVVLALACPAWSAPSAEEAVLGVCQGLSQGDVHVVWNALPGSYQNDIAYLVHTGAAKMDPVLWNKTFDLAKKLVNILKTKKEWILTSPQMQQAGPQLEKIKTSYDPMVGILSLLVNSEISDLDQMKKLDVGRFVAGTVSKIVKKGMAVRAQFGDPGPKLAEFKKVKVTQLGVDQGVASVSIEAPDKPAITERFVQVEGKWVPQTLATAWPTRMAQAKARVEAIDINEDPARAQQLAMLDMVGSQLDLLDKAETPEQFNAYLAGAQMAIVGMAMQVQQGLQPHGQAQE